MKNFRKDVIETVPRWLKRRPDSRDPYARVRVPVRKGQAAGTMRLR